jgi:flavodoxin I
MANIGIFYGSSTGDTEKVADIIAHRFGGKAKTVNVEDAKADDLKKFDVLILGTSTWEIGEMQEDWDAFIDQLKKADLKDKKVAIFGLGDQEAYGESFADGAGILYQAVEGKTTVIGQWPTDGYDFIESMAVKDGKFVGLILDEDNQKSLTAGRVEKWVEQLIKSI